MITETIQQLKEDISILQEKLQKLEEIENQSHMDILKEGQVFTIAYNHIKYYRMEFLYEEKYIQWWRTNDDGMLVPIEDSLEFDTLENLFDDNILDNVGVEEKGTWNYDPDAKFRKQEEVKKGVFSSVNKPKTLTDLIHRWWDDIFSIHSDWDSETSIADLVDQIQLWLPKEQSGSPQNVCNDVDEVKGFNDAIKQIKSKLR